MTAPLPDLPPLLLCCNCRFWLGETENGACRRYAPRPAPPWPGGYAPGYAVWPITTAGEWCGEHAPRPPPAPPPRPYPSPLKDPAA